MTIPTHTAERFARFAWRVALNEWTVPSVGLLMGVVGIIWALNK